MTAGLRAWIAPVGIVLTGLWLIGGTMLLAGWRNGRAYDAIGAAMDSCGAANARLHQHADCWAAWHAGSDAIDAAKGATAWQSLGLAVGIAAVVWVGALFALRRRALPG